MNGSSSKKTNREKTKGKKVTQNKENKVRKSAAPNFCPPEVEGATFQFEDEKGDITCLEFLGVILHENRSYGFFVEIDDESQALKDGEVTVLEIVRTDEEGQPAEFELVTDEEIAKQVYAEFTEATKDLYTFA